MPGHLTECALSNELSMTEQAPRTFRGNPRICFKVMDRTQGLCCRHPSLVLGQSIRPL